MDLKEAIRRHAERLGFSAVGFTTPEPHPWGELLPLWTSAEFHGEMAYMARRVQERMDPRLRFPWVRSVIVLAASYHAPQKEKGPGHARISRYARFRDYHRVLEKRLKALAHEIGKLRPGVRLRHYVDTGPIQEKLFAEKAGLGWIGKHTNLILGKKGSWFFLAVVLTDLALEPDPPATDHCGRCRRCIEACPTGAIVAPYLLDARRCISYLTVELKGAIPQALRPPMGSWVLGCDICQEVCPWNRDPESLKIEDFRPREDLVEFSLVELLRMDEGEFRTRFAGTPLMRPGWRGVLRNALVAAGNARDPALLKEVRRYRDQGDPLLEEHAHWAETRILEGEGSPRLLPSSKAGP